MFLQSKNTGLHGCSEVASKLAKRSKRLGTMYQAGMADMAMGGEAKLCFGGVPSLIDLVCFQNRAEPPANPVIVELVCSQN